MANLGDLPDSDNPVGRWFGFAAEGFDPATTDLPVVISIPSSPSGEFQYCLNVRTPDLPFDSSATPAQLGAVMLMWPHLPTTLSYGHCHALLSYRDYARHVIDAVDKDCDPSLDIHELITVTMVSYYDDVARHVRRWSERRFRDHAHASRIANTKYFWELINANHQLLRCLSMLGNTRTVAPAAIQLTVRTGLLPTA